MSNDESQGETGASSGSVVHARDYDVFRTEYGDNILIQDAETEDAVSPHSLEAMSDIEAINAGHDIGFPPEEPSEYQD